MSLKKTTKDVLRPLSPKPLINAYHYGQAVMASSRHAKPSEHMIVIGVVGSKGKTTTANMLWSILSADGTRVGLIGTANIRYGQKEELNKYHMTMPGAGVMQSILERMAKLNCKYVVMEVPSEGQTQYRHKGINFDVLVFTNVTKELMAAHNFSLETLHKHNKRVFKALYNSPRKEINGQTIPKIIVANADSKDAAAYLQFPADQKLTFSVKKPSDYKAAHIESSTSGVDFTVNKTPFHIQILGSINVINAAGAIAAASALNVTTRTIQRGLSNLQQIPGRMEVIKCGQPFTVIVDYAHEQTGMTALMESAQAMKVKAAKVIVSLGAEGGGRDVAKRPEMGAIVARSADYIVICNVDPYNDDPQTIINDIAAGAEKAGAVRDKNEFLIIDRRAGIKKALELAKKDDIVLITGKGSEQSIVINGKSSPWDDRKVVREELKRLGYNKK